MATTFETRYASSPKAVKQYDTQQLRDEFLVPDLMQNGQIKWVYTHYDRYMAGGAVPTSDLKLESIDPLKVTSVAPLPIYNASLWLILKVSPSTIILPSPPTLMIPNSRRSRKLSAFNGSIDVTFKSDDASSPAKFYMNSAPAHKTFPTKKTSLAEANKIELGSLETANHRTVSQMIIGGIITTCQLQMGMTELKTGSVWNTMPAHVHDRRMEIYFYLDVPQEQAVCHFMGQPQETRHIWMHNHEAVISPPWSIHSGSGTSNYTFIWGMAGENLDYNDMDVAKITDLR